MGDTLLRDLRKEDVPILAEMGNEEEILKYFFSSGNKNVGLYWAMQLPEDNWIVESKLKNRTYVLPIEHEDTVKGCITLKSKINSKEIYFSSDNWYIKDFSRAIESHEHWSVQLTKNVDLELK